MSRSAERQTYPVVELKLSWSAGQSATRKGRPQFVEESRATADCRGMGGIESPVDRPDEGLGRELGGDNSHLRADD